MAKSVYTSALIAFRADAGQAVSEVRAAAARVLGRLNWNDTIDIHPDHVSDNAISSITGYVTERGGLLPKLSTIIIEVTEARAEYSEVYLRVANLGLSGLMSGKLKEQARDQIVEATSGVRIPGPWD
jgi:hypothetical protein